MNFRDFILKYTTALYRCPDDSRPRYDEFRDMLSRGQILSKEWLASEAAKVLDVDATEVCIAGAWYGTLAYFLHENFVNAKIVCLDVDERCQKFIEHLAFAGGDRHWLVPITADMNAYSFTQKIVINTSCEHLSDLGAWLRRLPSQTYVVLQSNNFSHHQHVATSKSLKDFLSLASPHLESVLFSGELDVEVYSRYMVIGKIK